MSEQAKPPEPPKQPVEQPKTPAITSANVPKPPVEQKVVVDTKYEDIVAKPLVDADFTKIKPKNPNVAFFLGNRIASGGQRLEDLLSRGFEFATLSDVHFNGNDTGGLQLKDNKLIRGDLVLLKIDRVKYQAQLKYNQQSADARVSRASNSARGREQLAEALKEVGGLPARYRGKIVIYNPDPASVENS